MAYGRHIANLSLQLLPVSALAAVAELLWHSYKEKMPHLSCFQTKYVCFVKNIFILLVEIMQGGVIIYFILQ